MGITYGPLPPIPLLLDDYPGSIAAWSICRKLDKNYAGDCIEVTRHGGTGDGDSLDIPFDDDGNIVQTDITDFVTLLGTELTNIGIVTKIYDQSGNSNDLITSGYQSVGAPAYPASAAHIYGSGVFADTLCTADNGKVAAYDPNEGTGNNSKTMWNSSAPIQDSVVWAFGVQQLPNPMTTPTCYLFSNNPSGGVTPPSQAWFGKIMPDSAGANHNNVGASLGYEVNGVALVDEDSDTFNTAFAVGVTTLMTIKDLDFSDGSWNDGINFWGWNQQLGPRAALFQEMILWNSDQVSNKTGIETNINDYYSIY